jgi:peroxiredoxin
MKHKKLLVGEQAPQFVAADVFGASVDLSAHKDKFVLLAFLRYSGCPLCNLTISRLTMEYQMLSKNGCEVIAFVQSPAENIKANIYGRHKVRPPYPIIADPKRRMYDMYGVGASLKVAAASVKDIPYWIKSSIKDGFKQTQLDGNVLMVPALFLVAPDSQELVKVEYGTSFYDHTAFTDIYEPLFFK